MRLPCRGSLPLTDIRNGGGNRNLTRTPLVSNLALAAALRGRELPVLAKKMLRDIMPDPALLSGYVIDASGAGHALMDNDGVDDSWGETRFCELGGVAGIDN